MIKKVVLPLLFFCFSFSLFAQSEAENAINEALTAYQNKKYSAAYSALQTAMVEINTKLAEEIATVFPAPLSGWNEEPAQSLNNSGMGMIAGGTGSEKTYSKEEGENYSTIKISITANSPMLSSIMMVVNNPMMAGNMGKSIKINGEKALEKYDAENQSDEINMVLDGKVLITVNASGIKDKNLVTSFVQTMDLKKLRAILAD